MTALKRVAAVSNDRQQPGARVASTKCGKVAHGAQRGVLHDILRIVLVAQKVPRQRVCAVEVYEYEALKAIEIGGEHQDVRNSRERRFIPDRGKILFTYTLGIFAS